MTAQQEEQLHEQQLQEQQEDDDEQGHQYNMMAPPPPPHRRHNGLSRPYSKAQIASLACLVFSALQWLFFIAPVLPKCVSSPVTLVFFAVVALVVHFGVVTIATDPLDVHLCQRWKETGHDALQEGQNNNKHGSCFASIYLRYNQERQSYPCPQEPMKHCWICDLPVAVHSMHCKFCNKCVYHFDHHCIWLNTCIGKANYRDFFRLLIWLFLMEVIHLAVQTFLLVDIFQKGPAYRRVRDDWIDSPEAVLAVLFTFVAFNCISIFLIGQLILFHRNLQKQHLTTYEFVVQDHKKRRELARREGDLEADRVVLVHKAEAEHATLRKWKLQLGGTCRRIGCPACDPLDLPLPAPEPDPEAGFARALGGPRVLVPGSNNYNNNMNTQSTDLHSENQNSEEQQQRKLSERSVMNGHANNHGAVELENDSVSTDQRPQTEERSHIDSNLEHENRDCEESAVSQRNGETPDQDSEEGYETAMEVVMTNGEELSHISEPHQRFTVVDSADQENVVVDAYLKAVTALGESALQENVGSNDHSDDNDAIANMESIEYDLNAVHQMSTTLNEDDDDDEITSSHDGEDFVDEAIADDLSAKSGCSFRSGRSSKASTKSGLSSTLSRGSRRRSSKTSTCSGSGSRGHRRANSSNGERDYTAF